MYEGNVIPNLKNYSLSPNLSFYLGLSIQTVILIIYVLLVIDIAIFAITLYIKLSDDYHTRRYGRMYKKLTPIIGTCTDISDTSKKIAALKTFWNANIIFEVLTNFSLEQKKSCKELFVALGYTDEILKRAKKELTPKDVKWFGLIQIEEAIPILFEGTQSKDFELSFHCYQSLAKIPMDLENRLNYLALLFKSNNLRDRMIEMLLEMKLSTEEYLDLLEHQVTELSKTVILRVLAAKISPTTEPTLTDRILPFLEDTKEVKIGSIVAIAKSENSIYFERFQTLYYTEQQWEVRAAIAKAMNSFSHENEIMLLKQMTNDSNWWVRFNASEVLSRKGREGVNALIDISLDSQNEESSKLAFSFLDNNKNVHTTVTSAVKLPKSKNEGESL